MINELWNVCIRYAVLIALIMVIVSMGMGALLKLGFDRYCDWIKTELDQDGCDE